MAKQQSRDWLGIGLLVGHLLLFLVILVPTLLNVESQELLVEFRYNFLKNFVGKVEWYWRYLPALASLAIFVSNVFIWKYSHNTNNKSANIIYQMSSFVPHIFLVVVVFAMVAALF